MSSLQRPPVRGKVASAFRAHWGALATALLIGVLCSLWEAPLFLQGGSMHYGVFAAAPAVFAEWHSWLPLAYRVAHGNLMPVLPAADPLAVGFSYFPYLTLWIQGFLVYFLGVVGAYALGHVLFPMCSAALLFGIFKKYTNGLWAFFLSAMSLLSFQDVPFRTFLQELFFAEGPKAALQPLDVAGMPFPAISLVCFLAVFLASIHTKRLSAQRLFVLTGLWALQSQIHPLNAAVGLMFWFLFFPLRLVRENPRLARVDLVRAVGAQALLAGVLVGPAVWAYWVRAHAGFPPLDSFSQGFLGFMGWGTTEQPDYPLSGLFAFLYFALPFVLTMGVALLSRTDPYELLFRFLPVCVLFAAELAVFIWGVFTHNGFPSLLLSSRLSMLFFHFYYLVPAIYYLNYRLDTFRFRQSASAVAAARKTVSFLANKVSVIVLPLTVVFLCVFVGVSANSQLKDDKRYNQPIQQIAWEELNVLTAGLPSGSGVVAEYPATNILVPIASPASSLWVERFSNRISEEEALQRLALYAKLFGYTEEAFVAFVSPGVLQGVGDPSGRVIVDPQHVGLSGVGFWLVKHRTALSPLKRQAYQEEARQVFRALDTAQALERFGIKRILAHGALSPVPQAFTVKRTTLNCGTVYLYERL